MEIIKSIRALDKTKIIRPSYGDTSLKFWEQTFEDLLSKLDFIEKYWNKVSSITNNAVSSNLQSIYNQLNNLTQWDETHYVTQKQNVVTQINQVLNEIKQHWPQYAIAAIEESGLLHNIDVRKEFEVMTKNMQTATVEALQKIETESSQIIEQAKRKAEEIEISVRKTAQKISVEAAQEQFDSAAKSHTQNIIIWGVITSLCIIGFIFLIISFLRKELPEIWTWQVIYYSVIRATLLGFIGTMIAFCLRILKAHLHMKEHNLHRKRIANSMSSFAESALNKEQRDLILSRLVDSVATFGSSGMIGGDEEGNAKITIDNITRTLTALKGQN